MQAPQTLSVSSCTYPGTFQLGPYIISHTIRKHKPVNRAQDTVPHIFAYCAFLFFPPSLSGLQMPSTLSAVDPVLDFGMSLMSLPTPRSAEWLGSASTSGVLPFYSWLWNSPPSPYSIGDDDSDIECTSHTNNSALLKVCSEIIISSQKVARCEEVRVGVVPASGEKVRTE